jgi:hypothetical protein
MFVAMARLTKSLRSLSASGVVEKAWNVAMGKSRVSYNYLQPLLDFTFASCSRLTTLHLSAMSYILAYVKSCDEGPMRSDITQVSQVNSLHVYLQSLPH